VEKIADVAESAREDADGTGLPVRLRRSLPWLCSRCAYDELFEELSSETSGTSGRALRARERMFRVIEDSEKGRLLDEWSGSRGCEKSATVERMAVVISSRDV